MTHELTIAALAFAVLAFPARACGDGECTPPKNPPEVQVIKPGDGEMTAQWSQPDQMPCCTRDGAVLYHPPLGMDRAGTRAFCAALDVALIPVCKTWRVK